jgi:hypothetical protein
MIIFPLKEKKEKRIIFIPLLKRKSQCQINFSSSSLPVKWSVAAVCCTHHFVAYYLVALLVSPIA